MKFFRKLVESSARKQKGVALIATLFTVAIILILGVSFLMMAFKDSSSTRTERESVLALQLAHAGAELMLNYMSVKDNWEYSPDSRDFLVALKRFPYNNGAGNPSVLKQGAMNEEFRFFIDRTWNSSGYYTYDVRITPNRTLGTDGAYTGEIAIRMIQAIFKSGQPPQYVFTSTGTVYKASSNKQVATRQIQVRCREKSALDNLIFVQNMRAWDLVGNGVTPPNALDGSNDAVGIPAGYTANGPVTIDGSSDYATETAGNVRFFSYQNVRFNGPTNINRANNIGTDGNAMDPNSQTSQEIFRGGLSTNQASLGLPETGSYMSQDLDGNGSISESEKGTAVRLAQDRTGTNPQGQSYVKAYYRCGDNDGLGTSAGTIGHSAASRPERWVGAYGLPNTPASIAEMSRNVPADVEFDGMMLNSKPGFAKFIVEFYSNGTVEIKKTTAYTKQTVSLTGGPVAISRFKNGIVYFEGGNVEVKNAQNNGGVNGQLTIVSAEDPIREAYAYSIRTTDGRTLTQYSTKERNMAAYPNDPGMWIPGKVEGRQIASVKQIYSPNSIYLPYDSPSLPVRVDPATGNLTGNFDRVPPYYIGGRWVWPGESTIRNTIKNVPTTSGRYIGIFNDIEREGNVTIGGNLTYANAGNNALGIIAKNYILLNADNTSTVNPQLTVNAVLMSFDHSLQFDDVNLSGKDNWISQPGMNGTFNFTGANISAFADVEGKIDGTGYTRQNLTYDQNLKNVLPPNFPRWDITKMPSNAVIEFVILNYQDKGATKNWSDTVYQ